MPGSAGEVAVLIVIVLICVGVRAFLAPIGFGAIMATVASVLVGLLLIAATLLLRTYPAIGITIYVLLALLAIGLAIYVNAYRKL